VPVRDDLSPPVTAAHTSRPNVLIMLADDMGFSDVGCYGGEIPTPNIDALADRGVRSTEFYNTARCSPSRASLLTGLHPHQTGVGELVNDDGPGGYPGSLGAGCATLAETFAVAGYSTHMTGKWHLANEREQPTDTWPTRRGFGRFWGTLAGAGSYVQTTTLHDGETPIELDELPADFLYTDEIGRHAAAAISEAPSDRPFFGYVAFTAPHWPLHAPESDIATVHGLYDEGWDILRQRRRARQVEAGICPADSTVDELGGWRDPHVAAWSDVVDRDWQIRRMEVYAAQVVAMDRAVGMIMEALERSGRAHDTVVIFLSDNGGCAEELSAEPGQAEVMARQHLIVPPHAPDGGPVKIGNDPSIWPGTPDTYCSYGQGWANLSNTPFRLYKRWVHEGGIATPLIMVWPGGNLPAGTVVAGPHQLTDIAPTLFAATGVAPLTERTGVPLPPLPGISMLPTLRGEQPTPHRLFWEHIGNQAIRDGRWKLVREHGGEWELYDLGADRGELDDRSAVEPDRVDAMADSWQQWADTVGVLPREDVLAAQATARRQPG
jgi:arylsulfatase A-like enzyme